MELASPSRNETSTGRDARSVASRPSVSSPQGTRVTYVTYKRSSSGTQAASKRYGNEMPTLPDSNPCTVWIAAQLGEEKWAKWLCEPYGLNQLLRSESWSPRQGRAEDSRLWSRGLEASWSKTQHKLSGRRPQSLEETCKQGVSANWHATKRGMVDRYRRHVHLQGGVGQPHRELSLQELHNWELNRAAKTV